MFRGLTAWFSESVSAKRRHLWKQHGGKEVHFDDAQFVFSEDCQSEDTKRIYQSEAYMNEHLAIFHASYINECVKKGDSRIVVLGKYFMPPLEVQKTNMNWEWIKISDSEGTSDENEDEQSVSTARSKVNNTVNIAVQRNANITKNKSPTHTVTMVTQSNNNSTTWRPANHCRVTRKRGVVSENTMVTDNVTVKIPVNRCDASETGGMTAKKPTNHCNTTATDDVTVKRPINRCVAMVTADTAVKRMDENALHNDDTTKKNNDGEETIVISDEENANEDTVHIDTLPKIAGVIEDLIPGQQGVALYLKTS